MTCAAPPSTCIRQAHEADLPLLPAIERSAATLFCNVGLGWIVESPTVSREKLEVSQRGGTVWVATDQEDEPCGFLLAYELDGTLYIDELSVAAAWQKRGLGRSLLYRAISYARSCGYPAVTLTTYRDIPWNGPFYSCHGFVEMSPDEISPGLRDELETGIRNGHDPDRRCAMTLRL